MKISTKISSGCLALVILSALAFIATVVVQRTLLSSRMQSLVRAQAHQDVGKIVQTLYYNCIYAEKQNQIRLTHDLEIARELLNRSGQVSLDTNTVGWTAVNQFTHDKTSIHLPKALVGGKWLGQSTLTNENALIVDEVRHLTGDFCTIFQRMNDDGDMLRVDTSVINTDGTRAIGTYIPHQNPDGSPNVVVSTVMSGDTYRGRAFVVNEYHETAYEPIWDQKRTRIIGMLYVGVGMTDINREIHDSITNIVVGKTGYVFVLDSKGTYVVSQHGIRDGESVWDTKDANGQLIVQSMIAKAKKMSNGSLTNEIYSWKNPDDVAARTKFAVLTSFAPWDWVIGAGAYEDDYETINLQVVSAMNNLLCWTFVTAGLIGLLGFAVSFALSRSLTRPIIKVIDRLNAGAVQTVTSASEVSGASQNLAEGSSEQAAAIEETSASLEEMASVTQNNAGNAQRANDLAREARAAADKGAEDMRAMSQAMEAIKASSDDISKIIKTIDEIAFQTNILALNAAVEAARAGEAGMGFAVVADEVRNLAQRSAQAAKETSAKIEGAISKTAQGVELNGKVAQALNEIVIKSRQVDELAAEVASASRQQTQGIAQINTTVGQMDKITQSNAASAEESAAAAEELNSQAEMMKQAVNELTRLVEGNRAAVSVSGPATRLDSRLSANQKNASLSCRATSLKVQAPNSKTLQSESVETPAEGAFKDF